jgi:hypothetical protein
MRISVRVPAAAVVEGCVGRDLPLRIGALGYPAKIEAVEPDGDETIVHA